MTKHWLGKKESQCTVKGDASACCGCCGSEAIKVELISWGRELISSVPRRLFCLNIYHTFSLSMHYSAAEQYGLRLADAHNKGGYGRREVHQNFPREKIQSRLENIGPRCFYSCEERSSCAAHVLFDHPKLRLSMYQSTGVIPTVATN